MLCDICEQNPPLFMVGNMETGDQLRMCASCYARNGLEAAKAVLPPAELVEAAEAVAPRPVQEPPSEPSGAPRRPKRQTAPEEPQPQEGPASRAPETPPAAQDN